MMSKQKITSGRYFVISGIILTGIGIIAFLLLTHRFWFTQDDAFITYRYADNFLNGHGLVYNIGERVEGYTNFLWLIWLITVSLIGIDMIAFSQYGGIVFGMATIILLYFVFLNVMSTFKKSLRHLMAGVGALLLGSIYSFAYWSTAGLETAAFTFFVTAALFYYAERKLLAAPMIILAILLRPEGGILLFFIIIYDLFTFHRFQSYLKFIICISILLLIPYAIFKLFYYDSIIPNTFYAKTSFDHIQLLNGFSYAQKYFFHYLAAGGFLVPLILSLRKISAQVRIFLIFAAIYILYIILVGGDVLKVHRFFVPLMPVIILLLVFGVFHLFRRWIYAAPVCILILAWQILVPYNYVSTFHRLEIQLTEKMNTIIAMLKASDSSNFSIAVSTIGLAGYRLTGHTVIDLLGLTDTTIARHPEPMVEGMESTWRETHFNSRYILGRQLDYILFSTGRKPSAPAERALFLYSRFLESYRTVNFYINRGMNAIFKRYYPVEGEISRDVDVRFVQYFNQGINLQNDKSDFAGALKALDSAEYYCPVKNWPYLSLYRSIALNRMGNMEASYLAMKKMIELDTLAVEGYMNLCRFEYAIGNYDIARDYYIKTLNLSPWQKPVLDASVDTSKH